MTDTDLLWHLVNSPNNYVSDDVILAAADEIDALRVAAVDADEVKAKAIREFCEGLIPYLEKQGVDDMVPAYIGVFLVGYAEKHFGGGL